MASVRRGQELPYAGHSWFQQQDTVEPIIQAGGTSVNHLTKGTTQHDSKGEEKK